MPLLPLVGHLEARRRVADALRKGRLPHTILISGPPGSGKQRFALWVAQLLVCREPGDEPCGSCPGCRKVLNLAHPDVHWLVPIRPPKGGDPDKQVEEAAEAIAAVLAERREQPLWTAPDGMASHGVASARLLLRHSALTAVEGGRKVFLVGGAERLVPQESSPEAANALLKVMEEPPGRAVFLLTAQDPARLLPTVRSRAVPLRLGPVADAEVGEFLAAHLPSAPSGTALKALVAAAQGCIGRAVGEDAALAKGREAAGELLGLVRRGKGAWLERALRQTPWQARGEFSTMLAALAALVAEEVRVRAGGTGRDGPDAADELRRLAGAVERVREAWEAAQGNVNPQLLLAVLGADLEEALCA